MRYAGVIVDISGGKLDRIFTYRIPDELEGQVEVGSQVEAPFGKGNRRITAFVVEITDTCACDAAQVKDILGLSPRGVAVESHLIQLAWWMKEEYGASMLQALKTVMPVKRTVAPVRHRHIRLQIDEAEAQSFAKKLSPARNAAQLRLLEALLADGRLPYETVTGRLHIGASTIRSLREKGIIEVEEETAYRNPVRIKAGEGKTVELNEEQRRAAETILRDDAKGIHGAYLLYGVTGSGKTEVYMELIDHMLRTGRQVIVLIPEIALTYQTVMRFYRRFGDKVSILHSRMSEGERYDQFVRAKKGEIQIMVGPRSALFTPFTHLGLIIIDEEQESSYKSELSPRYHAVGVAEKRASMTGASVVLGSATPSLDSFYRCQDGRYKLLTLSRRAVKEARLPSVEIVDLREELVKGNKSIISLRLANLLEERLNRGEQSILFLNRRGFSGFVSCRSCGEALKCPHCDVSLTLHRGGRLVCHYCGFETGLPRLCPSCGSRYIAGFGIGTQKVEAMVAEQFPQARILRMDADTTARKGGHEAILSAFADRKADILIGTQMIVKGHDFPQVTLVGILAADLSLRSPSYDAAEKTFQLLTQAAGRAGRDRLPGQVVIQTYSPEHYSIRLAAAQDYDSFYGEELAYRQMLHYPPVYAMMTVLLSSKDEQAAERAARACGNLVERYIERWKESGAPERFKGNTGMAAKEPELIGPCDAAVSKINDIYRKTLYIRHVDRRVLVTIKDGLESLTAWREEKAGVSVQYDISR